MNVHIRRRFAALGATFALSASVLAIGASAALAVPPPTQLQRAHGGSMFLAAAPAPAPGPAPAPAGTGRPGRLALFGLDRTVPSGLIGSDSPATALGLTLLAVGVGGIAMLATSRPSRRRPQLVLISSRVPTPERPEIHEREARKKAA